MCLKRKSGPDVLFARTKLLYQSIINHRNVQTFSGCFTERCLVRCIHSNSKQIYSSFPQVAWRWARWYPKPVSWIKMLHPWFPGSHLCDLENYEGTGTLLIQLYMKLCIYFKCFFEDWHDICEEKLEQSQRDINPSHHHCCYFQRSTLFLLQCSWHHYATVIQYLSVRSSYITTLCILPKSHMELL